MFIFDRIKCREYEYIMQDKHIRDVFSEANKRNINTLVLTESNQNSIHIDKWLHYAQSHRIELIFTKEINCFIPLFENKVKLLFVSTNRKEYAVIRRVTKILNSQYITILNEEAIEYFKRIHQNIWFIENNEVKDLITNKFIGNPPCLPIPNSEIIHYHSIGCSDVMDYETYFGMNYFSTIDLVTSWEENTFNLNVDNLLDELFSKKSINPSDEERLVNELNWLKETSHDKVFWLANHLKNQNIKIEFKGSFYDFLSAYYLGLIKRKPKKLHPLDDSLYPKYIFLMDHKKRSSLMTQIELTLSKINLSYKYPLTRTDLLFHDIIDWYCEVNNDDIQNLTLYKDIYDSKYGYEKVNTFFEDMKLFFLVYPREEKAFRHALYFLTKGLHKKWHQHEVISIVDNDKLTNKGNNIMIDTYELKERFLPFISIKSPKKTLTSSTL